jgi:uncharacterized protein (TIGR03905 family)
MKMRYRPFGICPSSIEFDLESNTLKNVSFAGGCSGNLKAISILLEGKDADEVVEMFNGHTCGRKPTSCVDQLAKAIRMAQNQQAEGAK